MANKGYYVKKTKHTGLKVFCVFLALLFLAACAGGGYGWYQVFNLKKQVASLTTADSGAVAIDGDGNELKTGETYAMPSSMAFMRSVAEEPVEAIDEEEEDRTVIAPGGPLTLTAKINTEFGAYVQGLSYVWTVEFVNPSTELEHTDYKEGEEGTFMDPFCQACNAEQWIESEERVVSDYITITPTTETADIVEVECLQPFGCPMTITVSLETAPEVKGTCRLDYIRRITYDRGQFNNYGLFQLGENIQWWLTYEYGVGTVKGETNFQTFSLKLESIFFTYVKKMLTFDISAVRLYPLSAYELSYLPELGVIATETTAATSLPTKKTTLSVKTSSQSHCLGTATFIEDFDSLTTAKRNAILYAWYYVCQHRYTSIYTPNIYVDLLYDYTYNGVEISTFGLSNGKWRFTNEAAAKNLEPNELIVNSSNAVV